MTNRSVCPLESGRLKDVAMNRINTAILTLMIVLASAGEAPILAAETSRSAMPEPIERASADDCAIFVELGRKKLDWGAAPPTAAFYPEWPGAGGGTYLEECPWKQLGVAEPPTPSQNPNESFFITRPIYSGSKPTTATVSFEYRNEGNSADGQPKRSPFFHHQTCSFEKREQGWLLMDCKTDFIT